MMHKNPDHVNRTIKRIVLIAIIVSFAAAVAFYAVSPDQIVAHTDGNGMPDRTGNIVNQLENCARARTAFARAGAEGRAILELSFEAMGKSRFATCSS